jgi:hypothetical protein
VNIITSIKRYIISLFREAFIWHINSLEFRAKLFAAVIASTRSYNDCDKKILEELSTKIYDDEDRASMLVQATEEVIDKILRKECDHDLNRTILTIDREVKKQPRFKQKILIEEFKRFQDCEKFEEEGILLQQRVLEFLENIKK